MDDCESQVIFKPIIIGHIEISDAEGGVLRDRVGRIWNRSSVDIQLTGISREVFFFFTTGDTPVNPRRPFMGQATWFATENSEV